LARYLRMHFFVLLFYFKYLSFRLGLAVSARNVTSLIAFRTLLATVASSLDKCFHFSQARYAKYRA
jgi:hypothetical protein